MRINKLSGGMSGFLKIVRRFIIPGLIVVAILYFFVIRKAVFFSTARGPLDTMERQLDSIPELQAIHSGDRVLILAPHPDDEILGTGGLIQNVISAGAAVRIAYLTNGDHDQIVFKIDTRRIIMSPATYIAFGEKRRRESIGIVESLGLKREDLYFLGYPDSGLLEIWDNHWQDAPAFLNKLTGSNKVPYADNFSFGAPYKGESILNDLKKILKEYRPTIIFVTMPDDTNVDHEAAFCFITAASVSFSSEPALKILLYLIHQGDWPRPYYFHPEVPLLPPGNLKNSDLKWFKLLLKPRETEIKYRDILEFKTAILKVRYYLWTAFARRNELYASQPELQLKKIGPGSIPDWEKSLQFYGRGIGEMEDTPEFQLNLRSVSYIRTAEDKLLIKVSLEKTPPVKTGISLYLFGLRRNIPFGSMPKIRATVLPFSRVTVHDGLKSITDSGIKLSGDKQNLLFEVPLADLGNPEKLFTSLRVHRGELSLDATAWHLIDLK